MELPTLPTRDAPLLAGELMTDYARRTGLDSPRPARRYLWTDAFAVTNFLALAGATGERAWTGLALALVDQVHHVLGRHRPDDARRGWISGLDEPGGEEHPTAGGLRIGKPLPERGPREPHDPELEWERDGQYFHYLTKWMLALERVADATGEPRFRRFARELARAAHAGFVQHDDATGEPRMVWKASTDLARPLVASQGQHDPLDGLVTCLELATAPDAPQVDLAPAIEDFAALLARSDPRTTDLLGIGGLLVDALRLAYLRERGLGGLEALLHALLDAAGDGLADVARRRAWRASPARRLAFRELGLVLGLRALERLATRPDGALGTHARELLAHADVGREILDSWLAPEGRRQLSGSRQRDIDEVMLATCLVPDVFLGLEARGA